MVLVAQRRPFYTHSTCHQSKEMSKTRSFPVLPQERALVVVHHRVGTSWLPSNIDIFTDVNGLTHVCELPHTLTKGKKKSHRIQISLVMPNVSYHPNVIDRLTTDLFLFRASVEKHCLSKMSLDGMMSRPPPVDSTSTTWLCLLASCSSKQSHQDQRLPTNAVPSRINAVYLCWMKRGKLRWWSVRGDIFLAINQHGEESQYC